jgi:Transposase IS116/IS110/IS902 family
MKEVIPMKKRIYRKMPVNQFQPSSFSFADVGARLVVAVDVAKVDMVAAIAGNDGRVLNTIAWKEARTELEKLSASTPAAVLAPAIGRTTAAVVYTHVGDAKSYASAGSFVKAVGLNLKEKSSGTIKGQIKITKRGSSRVRHYLWLAVYRWIQKDPIAKAWYERKVKRDGGKSSRAAIALMRKLAKALYHVARGATFDSSKLFDVSRLEVAV